MYISHLMQFDCLTPVISDYLRGSLDFSHVKTGRLTGPTTCGWWLSGTGFSPLGVKKHVKTRATRDLSRMSLFNVFILGL